MLENANLRTTAMGIMPHRDSRKALELSLSLDIPFWPQLPNFSFFEDMYVQTSENFPGIEIDEEKGRISFNTEKFRREIDHYFSLMGEEKTYEMSERYSSLFKRFISLDLSGYYAIRGQVTGPVSFGFKVLDEELKPIIYNEEVRPVLFDFIQRKVNRQFQILREKNGNAFVWVDEPGLAYIFSGFTGYNDQHAKKDYREFMSGIEGPKGLHLCAEVNLPYLLELGLDLLSFDAIQIGFVSQEYGESIGEFIKRGGVMCWGIVPANSSILSETSLDPYTKRLLEYWDKVSEYGKVDRKKIASHSLLAPHRCCLREVSDGLLPVENIEERIVERAFSFLRSLSSELKGIFLS